jgi:hypothetical protein
MTPIRIGGADTPSTPPTMLGVDVWALSDDPDDVDDWGPIINDAIVSGVRLCFRSNHVYVFSTPIDLSDSVAVVFEGEAGGSWATDPDTYYRGAILVYIGTGDTPAINLRGSSGFVASDLELIYGTGEFTGKLVDLGATSSIATFNRVKFGSVDGHFATALCGLSLEGNVETIVTACSFLGFVTAIKGLDEGGAFSNVVRIRDSVFNSCAESFLRNIGQAWVIDGCTFEMVAGSTLAATPTVIDCDFAGVAESSFSWANNWIGDAAGQTTAPINQTVNNIWHANFEGKNYIGSFGDVDGALIQLNGPGTLKMTGVELDASVVTGQSILDLGNPSTAIKDGVFIAGNWTGAYTSTEPPILNLKGHHNVQILGNSAEFSPNLAGVSHERATYGVDPRPTVAFHSGFTHGSAVVGVYGNDAAGIIYIESIPSGGAAQIVDVTFGIPITSEEASAKDLSVLVTPIGNEFSDGAKGAAALPYAIVAAASSNTGWTLALGAAVAAGNVAFAYRVVQL